MDEREAFEHYLDSETLEAAPAQAFQIDDDTKANWALRKLAAMQAARQRRQRFVQAEIDTLQTWQAREDAKAAGFAEHLTRLLRQYYDTLLDAGIVTEKHKAYRLPHGTLTTRKAPVQYERDDDVLLPIVRPLGWVRVKEEPDWAEIKKRLVLPDDPLAPPLLEVGINEETGEVLRIPCPGVRVTSLPGEVFQVKLPEAEVSDANL